jgi:hypothetical protein
VSRPNISLGIAAGGLPVEGSLYGESLGTLMQSLVALKTAGYADPAISGPSVNMLTSTYWDKMVDGLLNNIAPAPYFPSPATGWAFQGQTWPEATYGDTGKGSAPATRPPIPMTFLTCRNTDICIGLDKKAVDARSVISLNDN